MQRKYKKKVTISPIVDFQINTLNTPFLIIVESPSKCEKIEKFLGFQYKCISSKGHIRYLGKVGSSKTNYAATFEIEEEKRTHVEFMRKIINQFDPKNIFLATDDDREGEAIAWHICEVFSLNTDTTKRIIFHEMTKEALIKSVEHPILLRMNIVKAQQTRQILDRIIGFKISPFLTKLLVHDNNDFLSAGRCQTPALRLVYDNCLVNQHKSVIKLEYEVMGTFFSHPSTLKMKLHENAKSESMCLQFLELSKLHAHILSVQKSTNRYINAPRPFNTSSLLQSASSLVNCSPKQTMSYCQELYQEGHITYMRTDSTKYAKPFLQKMEEFLSKAYGLKYCGNQDLLENKNTSDPHEAIRITDISTTQVEGDVKKKAIYKLIFVRTFESCMSPFEYTSTTINISAPLNNTYDHDIETGIFLGWKRLKITEKDFAEDQQQKNDLCNYIKNLSQKQIQYSKIEGVVVNANNKSHFTEAGLIKKMEDLGIGRPSTFSILIETIQTRKYVAKMDIEGDIHTSNEYSLDKFHNLSTTVVTKTFGGEKNKLLIDDLGKQVICVLLDHFSALFAYDYTKQMEDALDDLIQNYEKSGFDIIFQCEKQIKECMQPLQDKMKQTYKIDDNSFVVFGKNGAYIKYENSTKTSSIKPNIEIDFEKLTNKMYSLDELIELKDESLGIYENEPLLLKKGKYGPYVQWGTNVKNLRSICPKNKSLENLSFDQICAYLNAINTSSILRQIGPDANIQNGKYGPYIYYKTEEMKKPKFFPLKSFRNGFMTCDISIILDWLKTQHNVAL
jgi:DNA topoisomerase-1